MPEIRPQEVSLALENLGRIHVRLTVGPYMEADGQVGVVRAVLDKAMQIAVALKAAQESDATGPLAALERFEERAAWGSAYDAIPQTVEEDAAEIRAALVAHQTDVETTP